MAALVLHSIDSDNPHIKQIVWDTMDKSKNTLAQWTSSPPPPPPPNCKPDTPFAPQEKGKVLV
jgi:hypothetical protein